MAFRGDKKPPPRPDKKSGSSSQQRGADKVQSGADKTQRLLAETTSHMESGKYGRASAALKQILSSEPDHPEALRLSATLHLKLGSLVAARTAFDKLAQQAFARQDYPAAESLLREYLAVGPRYVPFIELLGQALERTGYPDAAVAEYGKVVEIFAEDRDPDLSTKGAELFEKIKTLEPNGEVARRLTRIFDPLGGVDAPSSQPTAAPATVDSQADTGRHDEPMVQMQQSQQSPPAAAAPSDQTVSTQGGAVAKPWEEQSAPAPFPWEMDEAPPALASEPPASESQNLKVGRGQEEVAPPPDPPFVVEPTPVPPPVEPSPEPVLAQAEVQPAVRDEPPLAEQAADLRLKPAEEATESTPLAAPVEQAEPPPAVHEPLKFAEEEPAATQEAPSANYAPTPSLDLGQPPVQEAAPDSAWSSGGGYGSFAEAPSPSIEPAPDSASTEHTFAFGSGAVEEPPAPSVEETADRGGLDFGIPTSELAGGRESQESTGLKFSADADSGVSFQEAPAPSWVTSEEVDTPAPSPAYEDTDETEQAPAKKKRRRGRSRGPTWAAPTMSEDAQGEATSKFSVTDLFPTAGKMRFRITVLTRRVTSAVRSVVVLCFALATTCAVIGLLGVGVLSLTWVAKDEEPSNAFHNLSGVPPPSSLSQKQNGYAVLQGLRLFSSSRPVQVGVSRIVKSPAEEVSAEWPQGFPDVASTIAKWYGTWDPAAEFERQGVRLASWSTSYGSIVAQYRRWIGKPVADLGYGSFEAPDEAYVLALHRLYVAAGFTRGVRSGIIRLERDLESWRRALANAKSLRLKMLAAEALRDDFAIVSGLLARASLPSQLVPTLAKMGRPLDQAERSMRWAMQSQFVVETNMIKARMEVGAPADAAFYRKALIYMPLPQQLILNRYADYYEALTKHDSAVNPEGDPRKGLPQRYSFYRAQARTLSDYVTNPIDNLLIQETRVDWDDVIGRILETDARTRLITLQARLRRDTLSSNGLQRVAQAGRSFYDPFTGFTMLHNDARTVLYSVGRDGEDNEGDLGLDVSVPLYIR